MSFINEFFWFEYLKDEKFDELKKRCEELETEIGREANRRKDVEMLQKQLNDEKMRMALQLEQERESLSESEERSAKLVGQKHFCCF